MACVVLKPGIVLSANDLPSHRRKFLANYKIPRRVEFSDSELPKSGAGKILKRLLRERFWAHEERAVGYETTGCLIARQGKFVCMLLTVILSESCFTRFVFADDEPKRVPAGDVLSLW